jgi:hypothetical protein
VTYSTATALAPVPAPDVRLVRLGEHRATSHPHLTLVPPLPPDPRAEGPPELPPPPGAEVRQWLAGVLEVLDGRRPVAQLGDLVPPDHRRTLLRQAKVDGPGPRTLRSVHLRRTSPKAVDLCARLDHGRRSVAMTGRLEPGADRWRFTLLAIV